MGHEFPWEEPQETPIGEDPDVDDGRPEPGTKIPDPLGFPFGWWQAPKWAYVALAAASSSMGVLGVANGWVPHAYYGFVLQIASLAIAAHLDDAASPRDAKRSSLRGVSRWERPAAIDHPDLRAGTPQGDCIDRTLELARDADLFRHSVDAYVEAIRGHDAGRAFVTREIASASLARFKASAVLAASTYDASASVLPTEVRDVVIRRQQVTNLVREIVRRGALPEGERDVLRKWPVLTEARLVDELRTTYRSEALPPTLTGATLLVLMSAALRRIARQADDFLPNGM